MPGFDRASSIGYLVNQAARLTYKTLRFRLGPSGPNPAYLPVMLWLFQEPGLTQAALGRRAGIEQPSMAAIIKRMERDGLLRRKQNAADRREHYLFLSAKAVALAARLHPALDEVNALTRGRISAKDVAVFLRVIKAMIGNMEAHIQTTEE